MLLTNSVYWCYTLNCELWLFWMSTWMHVRYTFLLHSTGQYTNYYRQLRRSRLILCLCGWLDEIPQQNKVAKANLSQTTDATAAAFPFRTEQKKIKFFNTHPSQRLLEAWIRRGGIKIKVERIRLLQFNPIFMVSMHTSVVNKYCTFILGYFTLSDAF